MPPTDSTSYKQIRIAAIRKETDLVKTFVLEHADGTPIQYKAGQFLTFILRYHSKVVRRSFSISTSPEVDKPVAITIKRVPNGIYSRFLVDDAKVGDVLETAGVSGLFTIPDDIDKYEQVFFLAAGIGITPVFSLIKTLLHTQPHIQVVLLYSNRNVDEAVFYNDLQALAARYKERLRIEYLYSSSFNLSRARLSKWLLPTLVEEYATTDKSKMLFYVCGPFSYMRMVQITLEEIGIPGDNVKKENFNTEVRHAHKIEPPDKDAHKVTIIAGDKRFRFYAQYPNTILQAARKQGIDLPYSCETGRCGSCAARCIQGKVWLSYNEVLTKKDLEKGLTLTCVGYPTDGDVTLEL